MIQSTMLTAQDRKDMFKIRFETRRFETRFKEGFIEYLDSVGYFSAPSSKSWHGVWAGGNFDHSSLVWQNLKSLNSKMSLGMESASIFIIGMFHDLCKSDLYLWDDEQQKYIHNPEIDNEEGHAVRSIAMLEPWVNLTEEERLCIRYHMGAYETSDWGEMDEAIAKYPSVYWTHVADMMAAKIQGI